MLLEAVKLFVPAIISALLSGIWVSRWKAGMDHADKRIDDLCTEITKIADLASDYWMLPATDPKNKVLEARITSGLYRIAGLRATLINQVAGLNEKQMVDLESNLVRAATGGDFGVHNRNPSTEQACGSQHAASALVLAIRRARLESFRRSWLPRV